VRNFTEALAYELRRSPVRVCCLNPGGTATEFLDVAGHDLPKLFRLGLMTPERVAKVGVRALFAGRRNVVAGLYNQLTVLAFRFLPRRVMVWLTAKFTN
jgi:short-subunit dehydrogenase